MRKDTHELNGIPNEFREDGAPEYARLPDEFNRDAPSGGPEKRSRSSMRKVMLYLAATGITILGVIKPVVRIDPSEEPEPTAAQIVAVAATPTASAEITAEPARTETPTEEPTQAPTEEPTDEPTAEPTVEPTAEPTVEPTAEPTAETTSNLTGTIHIIVYSDILDMDRAMQGLYPSAILAEETLDAASFTEYVLPPLPETDGYNAAGYVLLAGSSRDYLDGICFGGEQPHAIGSIPLDGVLTADDLAIVPNNDGVYEAEIHVVWYGDFTIAFYDGDQLFSEVAVGFPLQSEGLYYLTVFPTPQSAQKTFIGWCDADGNLIDAVTYYDFFEKLPDAQTPEDRDWSKRITCEVYACWSDGSGGAPERVEQFRMSCINCSFLADGEGAKDGLYPKGTQITVVAYSYFYYGWFSSNTPGAGRGSAANPVYGAGSPGSNSFAYSYTFELTQDTVVEFVSGQ